MIVVANEVVIDPCVRNLCRLPYPNHPKGCPNFGRKSSCPPGAPLFDDRMDVMAPIFAIVNEFDLAAHVERMRRCHPNWTERQLECCLYWQAKARKELAVQVRVFLEQNPGFIADIVPEAGGVNVTETLRRVSIILEWPPRRIVRQVALVGRPHQAPVALKVKKCVHGK